MTDLQLSLAKPHTAIAADPANGGLDRRWAQAHARRAAWEDCRSWRELFDEVLGAAKRRVLEVGCDQGDATFLLYVLGHQVHGTETSTERVRRLQARAAAGCASADFRTSDAEDLRFPPAVFDAVHARGLFATARRPDRVLLEWYRVLRVGGTALVVEREGRTRPGDLLRSAGFVDVRERATRLPRRCLPRLAREPWYRRWAARTASFRVAWGTRP